MQLAAGTSVGPYEVVSAIGAGGMGEVYRARDARLGRDVALKILPASFAADPDRRARFEREAQVLASLNHQHIAQIFGVDDSSDVVALVMEYVPGPTLAELIADAARREQKRPGLPVADALAIARQIASALEAAHEKGIVHRDLKPANIKVTDDGTVKVLDFGLAKALDLPGTSNDQAMNSPTITARGTELGIVIGTAAYMAPEQARGRAVDRRADIWAFGCVLYEMLTGQRVFQGEDVSDILASVLRGEPEWSALPSDVPLAIRTLLQRCLIKDRTERISSISTARFLLTEPSMLVPATIVDLAPPAGTRRTIPLPLVAAAVLVTAIGTAFAVRTFAPAAAPADMPPATHLAITLPEGDVFPTVGTPAVTLSPDGREVVFTALHAGVVKLFVRSFSGQESKPITGTEGALMPFFSPDGLWVAFFAQGKLKKVSVTGSASQVLCDAVAGRGGSWGSNDTIYFAPTTRSGLFAVAASGGTPQEVTRLDATAGEISHRWPQVLPGGTHLLFTIWTGPGWDEQQIAVQSLSSGQRRVLVRGGNSGLYVPSGHLVYTRADALLAQPMDLARLEVGGSAPMALPEQVLAEGEEGAHYAVSATGTLVYLAGGAERLERRVVWVDRSGKTEALPVPSRHYSELSISSDGGQAALQIEDGTHGIWTWDFARRTLTPFAVANGSSQAPVWRPDGASIVYRATRAGTRNLFWRRADATRDEERLTTNPNGVQTPGSWSPDGKMLVFTESDERTGSDIWVLNLDERQPRPFLVTADQEWNPSLSPDGRWLAYTSTASGTYEVYVQPFPGPGPRHLISTGGGSEPVWSPNGRELFYLERDAMMVVNVVTTPAFAAGAPRKLFEGQFKHTTTARSAYAVSHDGQRFLRIQGVLAEQPTREMQVVLNWLDELRKPASAR